MRKYRNHQNGENRVENDRDGVTRRRLHHQNGHGSGGTVIIRDAIAASDRAVGSPGGNDSTIAFVSSKWTRCTSARTYGGRVRARSAGKPITNHSSPPKIRSATRRAGTARTAAAATIANGTAMASGRQTKCSRFGATNPLR